MTIPELVIVFLALLLAALLVALIFRRDFRDSVLGGPGEASILGIITVKGVAIVLLCALLLGGILFALRPPSPSTPDTDGSAPAGPIPMRLNVSFQPDEVNPKNPQFRVKAFLKTPDGNKPIPFVHKVSEGSLSVQVNVPDMDTPFFIVFETAKGTWSTDDYSVKETAVTARKQ